MYQSHDRKGVLRRILCHTPLRSWLWCNLGIRAKIIFKGNTLWWNL